MTTGLTCPSSSRPGSARSVRPGCEHVFVLDSNRKGAIAELEVAAAAARLGLEVLRPMTEHCRTDLALEVAGHLWRVQCRWGRLTPSGDAVAVTIGGSSLGSAGYRRSTYSAGEVDLFGIYCGELDRCYLVPAAVVAGKHALHLRLAPTRNSQRACINLAANFEFEGAIAQLGERSAGSRKVAGSNPASSTTNVPPTPRAVGQMSARAPGGSCLHKAPPGPASGYGQDGGPVARRRPVADGQADI